MPRKGYIAKREVLADPIYDSVIVTKLINNIMLDGKKGIAHLISSCGNTDTLNPCRYTSRGHFTPNTFRFSGTS